MNTHTFIKNDIEYNLGFNDEEYGWFEFYGLTDSNEDIHAEGGLWFNDKELTDYDGVFDLPFEIAEKLHELGYTGEIITDKLNEAQ